jgi:hypothetical protein
MVTDAVVLEVGKKVDEVGKIVVVEGAVGKRVVVVEEQTTF